MVSKLINFALNEIVCVKLIDADGYCDYGMGTIIKIMPDCVRYRYLVKFEDDFEMLFREEELFDPEQAN